MISTDHIAVLTVDPSEQISAAGFPRYNICVDCSDNQTRGVLGVGIVVCRQEKKTGSRYGSEIVRYAEAFDRTTVSCSERTAILRGIHHALQFHARVTRIFTDDSSLRKRIKKVLKLQELDKEQERKYPICDDFTRQFLLYQLQFEALELKFLMRRKNLRAHTLARYAAQYLNAGEMVQR